MSRPGEDAAPPPAPAPAAPRGPQDEDAAPRAKIAKPGCRIYVGLGKLDKPVPREEVADLFKHCGVVTSVWVSRNPPGFAFVDFDTAEGAQRAISDMNGKRVGNATLKVELGRGERQDRGPMPPRSSSSSSYQSSSSQQPYAGGSGAPMGYHDGGAYYDQGHRRDDYYDQQLLQQQQQDSYSRGGGAPPPSGLARQTKSHFRIKIRGLDPRTSWQDLKDVMRQAGGDVTFTSILGSGEGVAEFSNEHDMLSAISAVDDTLIDGARVRVTRDYPSGGQTSMPPPPPPPRGDWSSRGSSSAPPPPPRAGGSGGYRRRSRSPPLVASSQAYYDEPPPRYAQRDVPPPRARMSDRPLPPPGRYEAYPARGGYSDYPPPRSPPRDSVPREHHYDSYAQPHRDERRR